MLIEHSLRESRNSFKGEEFYSTTLHQVSPALNRRSRQIRCQDRFPFQWNFMTRIAERSRAIKIKGQSLRPHLKSSITTHHAPRTPRTLLRAQHTHHARDLARKRRPPPSHLRRDQLIEPARLLPRHRLHRLLPAVPRQGRRVLKRLHLLPKCLPGLGVHIAPHGARVDGVDGTAVGKLAAPGARHALEGGLAATVNSLALEPHARGYAGDVDDAAGAVVREVGKAGLGEEDRC